MYYYSYLITHSEDPKNPRLREDNVSTIVIWHSQRPWLSDVFEKGTPAEYLAQLAGVTPDPASDYSRLTGELSFDRAIVDLAEELSGRYVILKLWLTLTGKSQIKAYPEQNSSWCGFMYAPRSDGALMSMSEELHAYSKYLADDVYGYQIYRHQPGSDADEGVECASAWDLPGREAAELAAKRTVACFGEPVRWQSP